MAILNILKFPDERLRTKATPVERVDKSIQRLASDMLETMYHAEGIGLAATQVDVHKALLVADVDRERSMGQNDPLCLINPELIEQRGETQFEEGCLSVPGCSAMVKRAEQITVRALGLDGKSMTLEADGLLAICIQHEMDHLQGKLFIDHLSPLKRSLVLAKMRKVRRSALDKSKQAVAV